MALWPGAVESTKDYVSSPKPNGYRSVHVMLRLPSSGGRLEVQIRTRRMHDHAERGDAAHAHYKAAALSGSGLLAALQSDLFSVCVPTICYTYTAMFLCIFCPVCLLVLDMYGFGKSYLVRLYVQ